MQQRCRVAELIGVAIAALGLKRDDGAPPERVRFRPRIVDAEHRVVESRRELPFGVELDAGARLAPPRTSFWKLLR